MHVHLSLLQNTIKQKLVFHFTEKSTHLKKTHLKLLEKADK